MKSYDMTIQIKPPQQCFQMGAICFAKFYKFNEILNFCPFFTLVLSGIEKVNGQYYCI